MSGLIGASPDGVVMKKSDSTKMVGLVEFKAPVHIIYDKMNGAKGHGIPRRYIVQVKE